MNSKFEQGYMIILNQLLEEGAPRQDRTGVVTLACFGVELTHEWSDGFPCITHRMLSPYPAIAEMTCFIRGLTDVRDFESRGCRWWRANLNDYNTRNNTPYNLDLGPIYGKLWRSWSMGRVAAPWPKLPVGVPATVLGVANGSGTGVLQNDRLYRCWNSMIARCYSKDNKNYDTYGAKGVHVCNRWLEFKNFYMDAKT